MSFVAGRIDKLALIAPSLTLIVAPYNPGMQNLLHNLNPEQLAAVTLPSQPALILAGAGSGKTRVLTSRFAWLVENRGVSAERILAITFKIGRAHV